MSQGELIELKDLSLEAWIELTTVPRTPGQEQGPGKVRGVRLLGSSVSIEGGGEGHHFQATSPTQLTWCDLCGEFIWGVYKQSLQCTYCRFTCHHRCRAFIRLNCSTHRGQLDYWDGTVEIDTNVDEQVDWRNWELSFTQVQQKVKEYNAQVSNGLHMVLKPDGSFTGVIKVHVKLVRPISVLFSHRDLGTRLWSQTSIYLPRDTAKYLHVSSSTCAHNIIQALLSKFGMLDDPRNFALFERSEHRGQVNLRKLEDTECPLLLCLCAGPSEKDISLLLKENEKGDVNWEVFSEPELHNFLCILQREEEERVKQIVKRYTEAQKHLQAALAKSTQI